jgi:hypothetical protein
MSSVIAAGLSIVGTFCWTWRNRCLRKTLLALKEADRQTELARERERRKTLLAISRATDARSRPRPHKALQRSPP